MKVIQWRRVSLALCLLLLISPVAFSLEHPIIISDRYIEALQFAYDLHKAQQRKGSSIPYISHLESVAAIVWKNGGTETEAIAALLHDAAEDQGGLVTLDKIHAKFGSEVANIVADCSDTLEVIKPDWKARKQKYIDSMPQHSKSSRLVSAADKLDNIRDINREYDEMGVKVWSKFKGTREQTIWYYKSLGEIYVQHGPSNLGKEILSQVALLELKIKGDKNEANT